VLIKAKFFDPCRSLAG